MYRRTPFRIVNAGLSLPFSAALLRPSIRRFFKRNGFRGYSDAEQARTFECASRVSFEDHANNVRHLSLPTLVGWCDDDPIVPTQIAAELAEACPPGPRLHFAEGEHNPQKSHATEIAEATEAWLHELGFLSEG